MSKEFHNIQSVNKKSADKQLHVIPNGKSFPSLDKLKKTLHVTEIDDEEKLVKLLAKGEHVYCYINPYDSEMSSGESEQCICLCWSQDRETAMDNYYNSSESI